MKKTVFILASMLLVLFASCKQSETDIIKSEFKQYVKENFDDPNDLKEIVDVEPWLMVNKDSLENVTREHDEILDKIVSNNKKMLKNISDGFSSLETSCKIYLGSYISLYMNMGDKIEYEAIPKSKEIDDAISNLNEKDHYSTYIIKYRLKVNDRLVLRKIYAIKYNNEKCEFKENFTMEDYDHGFGDVYRLHKEQTFLFSDITESMFKIQKEFAQWGINVLQ